jgi:hypothetical protein
MTSYSSLEMRRTNLDLFDKLEAREYSGAHSDRELVGKVSWHGIEQGYRTIDLCLRRDN